MPAAGAAGRGAGWALEAGGWAGGGYRDPREAQFVVEVGELALACLRSFTGDTIVHVGELIGDGTLSVGDAPWGRSTTRRFQEQLHSKFHCLLRVGLPTMATGRETLTVWRRSKCCPLMVPDDSDDEDGEEGAGLTMGAASDDSGGSSEDEEDEEEEDENGDENDGEEDESDEGSAALSAH